MGKELNQQTTVNGGCRPEMGKGPNVKSESQPSSVGASWSSHWVGLTNSPQKWLKCLWDATPGFLVVPKRHQKFTLNPNPVTKIQESRFEDLIGFNHDSWFRQHPPLGSRGELHWAKRERFFFLEVKTFILLWKESLKKLILLLKQNLILNKDHLVASQEKKTLPFPT